MSHPILITNATIYTPLQRLEAAAVRIRGAQIAEVGLADELLPAPDDEVLDAGGLLLAPGFIDLQLNGGFGHDFTRDPQTLWPVAAQLPRYGVTGFLPTIVTSPPRTVARAQEIVRRQPDRFKGATPLGLHVEGPFLNPAKRGAHYPEHLRAPHEALIKEWAPSSGVRLVTLAPELPGALDLVRTLRRNGVVVSAGHSLASYEEALAGFQAGVTYSTHLFNAMPSLHHRRPGLVGAVLATPDVCAGLIADGVHVHAALVRLVWQLLGPRRLNLVTDAMAALGMSPGQYHLGDHTVAVDEQRATLPDGTLAGSILSLDQALRNLIQFSNCSTGEALQTITSTPAALLGLGGRKGHIAPGYDADLTLLTPDLKIKATFVAGEKVYEQQDHTPDVN
ncbi:MAG: N-acetylglucosamine-6-phosphate deacetylase [Chloroflexota bacterium]